MQPWRRAIVIRYPWLASKQLARRIAATLLLLFAIRLGLCIPLPGLLPALDVRKTASAAVGVAARG